MVYLPLIHPALAGCVHRWTELAGLELAARCCRERSCRVVLASSAQGHLQEWFIASHKVEAAKPCKEQYQVCQRLQVFVEDIVVDGVPEGVFVRHLDLADVLPCRDQICEKTCIGSCQFELFIGIFTFIEMK